MLIEAKNLRVADVFNGFFVETAVQSPLASILYSDYVNAYDRANVRLEISDFDDHSSNGLNWWIIKITDLDHQGDWDRHRLNSSGLPHNPQISMIKA